MEGVIYLKSDVKLEKLFKDLDEKDIEKIEKASKGGFTEKELKELEEAKIDISIIKKNSTDEKPEATKDKTTEDVKERAEKIAKKYCDDLKDYTGDKYKIDNPQLKALQKAIDDGLLKDLADEGFTKKQIIDVISLSFDNVGIKNQESGKYSIPKGHGSEAKEVYDDFLQKLLKATKEDSKEIKEARAKLTKINTQISDNNREMQALEAEIVTIQSEVEEQIEDAIEESKKIAKEQKQEAKDVVKKQLDAYTSSNGDMTYDEFKQNVSKDLKGVSNDGSSKLADVVCDIIDAQRKMGVLTRYVEKMGDLTKETEKLGEQSKKAAKELEDLIKKESDKPDDDPSRTDPIGFSSSVSRFDFFIDKDKNNDITNEQEFLGAKDGFSEIVALDTNKDGIVNRDELKAGNVSIIQTNKDGTQQIKKLSDVFTSNTDGIDISSYKSTNEDIGNGNSLIGTFKTSIGGKTLDGYQTLDTLDWLDNNYEFSDEVAGLGRFANGDPESIDAIDYSKKIQTFSVINNELEEKINNAWEELGFNEIKLKEIDTAYAIEAKEEARKVKEKFEAIATEESRKADMEKAEKEKEEEKKKLEEEDE